MAFLSLPPCVPLIQTGRLRGIAIGSAKRSAAVPDLPMVGTGYSWLQKYAINAAAHNVETGAIRIMGMGRNSLAYPDFARDALEKGELEELRVCKTLTYCTWLMRQRKSARRKSASGGWIAI